MIKVIFLAILVTVISACSSNNNLNNFNYLNKDQLHFYEINESLADNTLELLVKRYPPAKTRLKLLANKNEKGKLELDYFAQELIKKLRRKGYAIALADTPDYRLLSYKISEHKHQIHLILNVADEQYSRIFMFKKDKTLDPLSSWSRNK